MKYFKFIAIAFLAIVIPANMLTSYALEKGIINWHYGKLYSYQLNKIAKIEQVDLLFVGDSSLGNAIDVSLCQKENGVLCTSLALTGVFGYAGSLGMIERMLERTRPKAVVLMQTLNMMARPVMDKAYGLISPHRLSVFTLPFEDACATLWNFDFIYSAATARFVPERPSAGLVARDYMPQRKSISLSPEPQRVYGWQASRVNNKKVKYLKKIVELCEKRDIPLIYVHGPLTNPHYKASRDFQQHADTVIASTGVSLLAGTPMIIPWSEAGDSNDHVAPDYRQKFTRLYLAKILKYLSEKNVEL